MNSLQEVDMVLFHISLAPVMHFNRPRYIWKQVYEFSQHPAESCYELSQKQQWTVCTYAGNLLVFKKKNVTFNILCQCCSPWRQYLKYIIVQPVGGKIWSDMIRYIS